jgi:hypothetical protein
MEGWKDRRTMKVGWLDRRTNGWMEGWRMDRGTNRWTEVRWVGLMD